MEKLKMEESKRKNKPVDQFRLPVDLSGCEEIWNVCEKNVDIRNHKERELDQNQKHQCATEKAATKMKTSK